MYTIIGIGNPEFPFKTMSKKGFNIIYIVDRDEYNIKKYQVGTPFIVVDSYEDEKFEKLIGMLCETYKVDGIVSFSGKGQYNINRISKKLGYNYVDLEAIEIANNKYKMRKLLDNLGLDKVNFKIIKSKDDLLEFADKHGYPIILKPIDMMGSIGIRKINGESDLNKINIDYKKLMAERYIEGDEISVECISIDGEHTLLSVTDKSTTGDPHFVEYQHIVNGKYMGKSEEIKDVVFKLLDAMRLKNGISHTEIKIWDGKLFIIETHVRPGGDCIMDLIEKAMGFDPYEMLTYVMLKDKKEIIKMMDIINSNKKISAGIRYLRHIDGKITAIEGFNKIEDLRGFYRVYNPYETGSYTHEFKDSFDRDGWIMAYGDDYKSVLKNLNEIEKNIKVETIKG